MKFRQVCATEMLSLLSLGVADARLPQSADARTPQSADARLPQFTWSSDTDTVDDHTAFGTALGARFKATIQARFADLRAHGQLGQMLQTYNTSAGSALYDGFLKTHERLAPSSIAELRGLAAGAAVPFQQIFLQNIPLEFTDCSAASGLAPPRRPRDDHCSDFQLCDPAGACAVGHNEDNDAVDLNRTALVGARFGARSWTAYTYLGELPSGAFGFNANVAFTLNWVGPTDVVCPGLGRGFVSRALLDAADLDAAVATATQPNQCAGHSFQLMRLGKQPSILNVEAAPRGLYAVRPIGADVFFHANQYQTLVVPQTYGNSSIHRLARAAEILRDAPPTTPEAIAHALGDQQDHAYPIFHDAASHAAGDLSDWTIATALFDLRKATLTVFAGNPRKKDVLATVALNGASA
jgi:hypothetical protein